jgi:hypothetical protein
MGTDRSVEDRRKDVRRRIVFYGELESTEWARYLPSSSVQNGGQQSVQAAAAQYVGLIVDRPAPWLKGAPRRRH